MSLPNFSERTADGLPVLEDNERIILSHANVACFLDPERSEGSGAMHVTTRFVYWFSADDIERGYRLQYNWISMHAVSRDPESFARPCVYCQLDLPPAAPSFMCMDGGDAGEEEAGASADAEADEAEDGMADDPFDEVSEIRFVPADDAAINAIFTAMSDGAALNPDPEEDAEGAGEFVFDEAEVAQGVADLTPEQMRAMERWDALAAGMEQPAGYDARCVFCRFGSQLSFFSLLNCVCLILVSNLLQSYQVHQTTASLRMPRMMSIMKRRMQRDTRAKQIPRPSNDCSRRHSGIIYTCVHGNAVYEKSTFANRWRLRVLNQLCVLSDQ